MASGGAIAAVPTAESRRLSHRETPSTNCLPPERESIHRPRASLVYHIFSHLISSRRTDPTDHISGTTVDGLWLPKRDELILTSMRYRANAVMQAAQPW